MGFHTGIVVYIILAFKILTSGGIIMATSDVLQDNTARQGSIVTQPSRSDTFANVKEKRTRNDYPLTQPVATVVETKYTNKFDDTRYYSGDTAS